MLPIEQPMSWIRRLFLSRWNEHKRENKKRKKRTLAILLVVLTSLALTFSAASANGGSVLIWGGPWSDGKHYDIGADDTIVFAHGWVAATPRLVQAFLEAQDYEVVITDAAGNVVKVITSEEQRESFGPIVEWEDSTNMCPVPTPKSMAISVYRFTLPPGDYTFHYTAALLHPITDGCPKGPGRVPAMFKGVMWEVDIYLHVSE
ncbi:MAG: hypothetical protein PVF70_09230 [Anaerolineales bacterium]